MQALQSIFGKEVMDSHTGSKDVDLADVIFRETVTSLSPTLFYDLICGLQETLYLSYSLANDGLLPDPKLFKAVNVLACSPDEKFTVKGFVAATLTSDPGLFRKNLISVIENRINTLSRTTLAVSLYGLNHEGHIGLVDAMDHEDSETEEDYCAALPPKLKKLFTVGADLTDVMSKYIYGTLGWGAVLNTIQIFDPVVVKALENRYGKPFVKGPNISKG